MTYRIGLDIGGTKTATLIVDEAARPIGQAVRPTDVRSPELLVSGTLAVVDLTLQEAGLTRDDLSAAGVGIPGQVNPNDGTVAMAVNLNLRQPYPLRAALEQALGVPVAVENDVRAAAWGAYHWTRDRYPLQSLAYLSIGTGISAGLVLDGRLYRGSHGMAGEIGHIPLDENGPRCACGQYGCLESVAAGPAIAAQAAALMPDRKPTTDEVYKLAAAGDPSAERVVARAAGYLGRAIHLLLMAYDVEYVALGGGVTRAGVAFEEPLRRAMAQMRSDSSLTASMMPDEKVVIMPADFSAGVTGAVYLAPNPVPEARQEANEERRENTPLSAEISTFYVESSTQV